MSEKTKKTKEYIQLSEIPKTDGWRIWDKIIPFDRLTDKQLAEAHIQAEVKELSHFNRSAFFAKLAEKLEEELLRRELPVDHYNTEFTDHQAQAREKVRHGQDEKE